MSFQQQVRVFLDIYDLAHTPQTHALDLVSEVGEVAKALLEATEYGRLPLCRSGDVADELGDLFYSLVALAESLDVDLEAALNAALDKYQIRMAAKGHPGS